MSSSRAAYLELQTRGGIADLSDRVKIRLTGTDRALETVDTNFTLLDWTVLGRQETWEDSPSGWPQCEPYVWWRRHDEY